jgi:predicted ArsR family transcriptional regulator
LRAIGVPALESGLEQPSAPRPGSKLGQLITMLMQPDGRSVDELSQALGWQAHTTRAVISRLGKSGHVVTRSKNDAGVSVYRIEATADA